MNTVNRKLKTNLGESKKSKPKEIQIDNKLAEKFHAPDKSNKLSDNGILAQLLTNYKISPKEEDKPKNKLAEKYLNKKEDTKNQEDDLVEKMEEVTVLLNKRITQESFKMKVFTSFFTGTAAALGATVGFTLLVFALTYIYNNFQEAPLIGDYLQNSKIIEVISESLSEEVDTQIE